MNSNGEPLSLCAEELTHWLLDPKRVSGKDYLTVDVRDEDVAGGMIHCAVNEPSETFNQRLPALIDEWTGIKNIVFHCMYSQIRGPKAARRYMRAVNGKNPDQKVHVLVGGFRGWYNVYGHGMPDLIKDYDAKYFE